MSNKKGTLEQSMRPASAQGRFSWVLPMVLVLLYLLFFAVFAFAPDLLGGGIGDDPTSPLAWGIPVALGLSLLAFVLASLYVRRVRDGAGE